MLDLFGFLDIPDLHFWDGLIGGLDLTLFEGLFVLQHDEFLVDELDLVHSIIQTEHNVIQDRLS